MMIWDAAIFSSFHAAFFTTDLYFPKPLTTMTPNIAMLPPMTERVLGTSCSQTQATKMAITGSMYNKLETELAFPNDKATAQVT